MKNLILLITFGATFLQAEDVYKRKMLLMGSAFEITIVAVNESQATHYIDMAVNEIKRIERLISSWNSKSQTSLINKRAGVKAVVVKKELFNLIKRSIHISQITDGAFDISYASMDKVWKFNNSMQTMPTPTQINASIRNVGWQNIVLNATNHTVFLKKKGMKIGFGAIGKGYAADKAKEILIAAGVKSGIINASGDMTIWGKQPDGSPWKVAVTNPLNKNKAFALLPIKNGSIVTSGSYEKYVVLNGERYSHIIDPRSGYPSKGIISATVLAPKAELADALATSVFVMGIESGLDRIEQIPGVEAIIINEKGRIFKTKNIKLEKL